MNTIRRSHSLLISDKDYGLLNFVSWRDELNTTSNIVSTHNRKIIHWLFFIHSDHMNFDLTASFENCAMWSYAKFSKPYKSFGQIRFGPNWSFWLKTFES